VVGPNVNVSKFTTLSPFIFRSLNISNLGLLVPIYFLMLSLGLHFGFIQCSLKNFVITFIKCITFKKYCLHLLNFQGGNTGKGNS